MKFLIAGFGSIGQRHFHNLKALGETDFVFYRSKLGTLPDDEVSAFPVETDLQTALEHCPDVVIITNPTALHLDVAIPAAKQGCHLFIEKPISHSMEGIDILQEAVIRTGVKVLVGFQFRYHPQLIQIKQLLSSQTIGQLIGVRAEWGEYLPDWHPWENHRLGYSARRDLGGGVVLTLSHPLDYLHWLIGGVSSLWSFTNVVESLEIEVDAIAEVGLHFNNGVIGSLHLDYVQIPNKHQLEIIGTNGKILWDYFEGTLLVYRGKNNISESFPLPAGFTRNSLFRDQMEHLLDIILDGVNPRCTLKDGIVTQKLALGIHESAQTGKIYRV